MPNFRQWYSRMITGVAAVFSGDAMQRGLIAKIMIGVLLGVAVGLAVQARQAPFCLDDELQFSHIQSFRSASDVFGQDAFGFRRPAKNLIFLAVERAGGQAQLVAHLFLTLFFLAAIIMLCFWLRLWLGDGLWTAVGCAVWALAPTLVSSVVWLSCANIMLGLVCMLGALICWEHLRARAESGNGHLAVPLAGSLVLYGVAFGCYEGAIVLPALAGVQDFIMRRRRLRSAGVRGYLGLVVAAAGLLVWRGHPMAPSNPAIQGITSPWQLSYYSAWFLLSHLGWWVWPFGRQEVLGTFVYGKSVMPAVPVLAWVALVSLAVVCIGWRKRFPLLVGGIAWTVIVLVPMCNFLPFFVGPYADYYLTSASVGLALALSVVLRYLADAVAAGGKRSARGKVMLLILLAVAGSRAVAAAAAFKWARVWRDPADLLARSIEVRPHAYTAKAALAHIFLLRGKIDAAEVLAREALAGRDDFVLPYNVLGQICMKRKRFDDAEKYFGGTLKIEPDNWFALLSLAEIYDDGLNDKRQAAVYYRKVIDSRDAAQYRETAYANLAIILAQSGGLEDAAALLREGLQEFPQSGMLQHNLQVTLRRLPAE